MGKPHTPLPSLTLKKPTSTGSKKPFTTPSRGVGWSALSSLTVGAPGRCRARAPRGQPLSPAVSAGTHPPPPPLPPPPPRRRPPPPNPPTPAAGPALICGERAKVARHGAAGEGGGGAARAVRLAGKGRAGAAQDLRKAGAPPEDERSDGGGVRRDGADIQDHAECVWGGAPPPPAPPPRGSLPPSTHPRLRAGWAKEMFNVAKEEGQKMAETAKTTRYEARRRLESAVSARGQ